MHLHSAAKPQRTKKRSAVLVASFSAVLTTAIIVQDALIVRKHKPAEVVARLQAALSEDIGTPESLHEVSYAHNTTASVQHYYRCTSHLDNKYATAVDSQQTLVKSSAQLEVAD
jgi:hypothetical protein